MTFNCIKLGRPVTFMKYLAGIVSLIFLPKTLICNEITILDSWWKMNLWLISPKKITNIPFSTHFIAAYCKDIKSL